MKGTILVRNISGDVKRNFKAACAKVGVSMGEVIESLMRRWTSETNGGQPCDPSTTSSGNTTSPRPHTGTSTGDRDG